MSSRFAYRKKRKLTPGFTIATEDELLNCAKQGRWVFFGGRAYHPSWIMNMNFACVCSYIRNAKLRFAERDPEWPFVFVAKFIEYDTPEKSNVWWAKCSELPGADITEITKESIIMQCEIAAAQLSGIKKPRVQVTFELPERKDMPVALIPTPAVLDSDIPF